MNLSKHSELIFALLNIELQLTEPIVPSSTFRLYFHHADLGKWKFRKLEDMVRHYENMKHEHEYN